MTMKVWGFYNGVCSTFVGELGKRPRPCCCCPVLFTPPPIPTGLQESSRIPTGFLLDFNNFFISLPTGLLLDSNWTPTELNQNTTK